MAIINNKIIKVWDSKNLLKEQVDRLRKPTKPVNFPLSPNVEKIIDDLIDSFQTVPCAGIAANQLGYDKKLFIGMKHDRDKIVSDDPSQNLDNIEPDPDNYEIYINPQIDKKDIKSTQSGTEACLSIPGLSLIIERYDEIKVRYYTVEGRAIKKPLKGFLSRLFQHELDHLNGKLMFENPISKLDMHYIEEGLKPDIINALFDYVTIK